MSEVSLGASSYSRLYEEGEGEISQCDTGLYQLLVLSLSPNPLICSYYTYV